MDTLVAKQLDHVAVNEQHDKLIIITVSSHTEPKTVNIVDMYL